MNANCEILLVDSDPPDRGILRNRLSDAGHNVHVETSCNDGFEAAKSRKWDAIIVASRNEGVLLGKLMPTLLEGSPGRDRLAVLVYEARKDSTDDDIGLAFASGANAFVGRSELPALVSVLEREVLRCRQLNSLEDTNRGLLHQHRKLKDAPVRSASSNQRSHGVEAVMLAEPGGVVVASDAAAGKLMGQSPVGTAIAEVLPNLNADRLVHRVGANPLVSEPFEQPSSLGPYGSPLELNVFSLYSGDDTPPFKLAMVTHSDTRLQAGATLSGLPVNTLALRPGLAEAAQARFGPAAFLGSSKQTELLRETAKQAAESDQPLLIVGGPGSGVRTVGKLIHCTANPLAPIEQLQAGLVPSEWILKSLDASSKRGKRGAPSTFLISQVDRMDRDDQERLATSLERLSGGQDRVILTATNPPRTLHPKLEQALSGRMISVLSLRERVEDIPVLANHFAKRWGKDLAIENDALQALMQYPWPGNVSELEAVIDSAYQAAATSSGSAPTCIGRDDLPEGVSNGRYLNGMGGIVRRHEPQPWDINEEDPISFDFYEKQAIQRALNACKGNRLACARMLHLGKSTLYRKLKRYGLDE